MILDELDPNVREMALAVTLWSIQEIEDIRVAGSLWQEPICEL